MSAATKSKAPAKAPYKKVDQAPDPVEAPAKVEQEGPVKFHCSGHNNMYTVIAATFGRDPVTGEKKPKTASHTVQFFNHTLELDPSSDLDKAAIDYFRDEKNMLIGNTIVEVKTGGDNGISAQAKALARLNAMERPEILEFFDQDSLASNGLTRQASKEELIAAFLAHGMAGSL